MHNLRHDAPDKKAMLQHECNMSACHFDNPADGRKNTPACPTSHRGLEFTLTLQSHAMPDTLLKPCHAELLIKKSRFIACIEPLADRQTALQRVQALREQHPGAAHVCWALMAGGHSAANDDGEPSGTAGRPMLDVLRHQQLEGVLATVVRYFGGVKLGAGGLVRAYSDSIATALQSAERITLQRKSSHSCRIPYPLEGKIRRLLQQADAELLDCQHGDAVILQFEIVEQNSIDLCGQLQEAAHGQLEWLHDEQD